MDICNVIYTYILYAFVYVHMSAFVYVCMHG